MQKCVARFQTLPFFFFIKCVLKLSGQGCGCETGLVNFSDSHFLLSFDLLQNQQLQ